MAGLCAPLPTLRRRPYGLRRPARGRYGSLLLHRIGLAPTARCRSPGALRKILYVISKNVLTREGSRSQSPAEVAVASILAAGLWALQTRSWRRPELHMKTARFKSTNRASRIVGTTRQEHRAGERRRRLMAITK